MANKRGTIDLVEFAADVYDVLGMNTNFITQKQFFNTYVLEDEAFCVSDEGDKQVIYFDDYKITIERN